MAPALIAVRPDGACVVVAVGAHLRIFDFSTGCAVDIKDNTNPTLHGDAIRSIAFNVEGSLFATVGDDKRVKLWDAKTWTCIKTICLTKKVSAVTFSNDSLWFMVADKFGIVYVFSTSPSDPAGEPVQLLAHCCSIITCMICSPDCKYIVTSDRDFKIRVTGFPEEPLAGAHEIHSYCLGHTNFVACLAFVGSYGLLVSGGGDCTVRLWHYESGTLLDTFDTTKGDESDLKEDSRAVVALASSPPSTVAAILERFEGVLIFSCDPLEKKLKLLKKVVTPGYCPSSLSFDCNNNLWMVAGAAECVVKGDEFVTPEAEAAAQTQAQGIALAAVTHVQVAREGTLLDAAEIPGGDSLLRTLQGSEADVTKVQSATEAAELAMKDLLSKRQYTAEQRENRKRMRNDKKVATITAD